MNRSAASSCHPTYRYICHKRRSRVRGQNRRDTHRIGSGLARLCHIMASLQGIVFFLSGLALTWLRQDPRHNGVNYSHTYLVNIVWMCVPSVIHWTAMKRKCYIKILSLAAPQVVILTIVMQPMTKISSKWPHSCSNECLSLCNVPTEYVTYTETFKNGLTVFLLFVNLSCLISEYVIAWLLGKAALKCEEADNGWPLYKVSPL